MPEVSDDVIRRKALASTAFGKLKKNVWSRNDLSLRIKSRLFYALIISIAIYTCETWSLKKKEKICQNFQSSKMIASESWLGNAESIRQK